MNARTPRRRVAAYALVAVAATGYWIATLGRERSPVRAAPASSVAVASSASVSTIRPADYAGSASCKDCHPGKFTDWSRHSHRFMNQDASPGTVRGDFSGVEIAHAGGKVTFATEPAGFTMTLVRGKTRRKYVVTRTVGSRFMQMFIGRQVEGPEPPGNQAWADEVKLPFGFWFKLGRWLHVSYFDPVGRENLPDGTPAFDPFDRPRVHAWRQNCMLCHNTVPYVERLAIPDGLEGFPQLEHPLDAKPLLEELGLAVDLAPRPDGHASVRERIQPRNLVQLGIGCEACHFGGAAHGATVDGVASSLLPSSPYLRWVTRQDRRVLGPSDGTSKRASAAVVNGNCAQCHCAPLVSRYPNGQATMNGREALDLIGGSCASAIRCTDCHDPHRDTGQEGLPTDPAHVATCTRCHPRWRDPTSAKGHALHSSEVTCLDCHMPRMSQGLEELVRSHRISSPTDVRMFEKGLGNACNLCHLDKPIGWTLAALREQFGREIAPVSSWSAFYGERLEKPVGLAWLTGANPSMRLVATQSYARSPLGKAALPDLIRALDDPISVNRVFDTFAIARLRGKELTREEYDVTLPSAERRARIEALLER